jgi:hypothetical protein
MAAKEICSNKLFTAFNKPIMRNVLIPTDFSERTFQLVERALEVLDEQPLTITLFHAFDMNGYPEDGLGSPRRMPHAHLLTDSFRNACKRIKEKNSKLLKGIYVKHMVGNTSAGFRNFVDANNIDLIVAPISWRFEKVTPMSIDPRSLFERSGVQVMKNLMRKRTVVYSAATLAETSEAMIN